MIQTYFLTSGNRSFPTFDAAKLDIDPTPDSVLRVFMAWKPLGRPQTIEPQTFTSFARDGFTVVEWGGCEVK